MPQPWLLVGVNVRALAQAAARYGHAVCGIDAFADRDTTAACAGRALRMPLRPGWRIDVEALSASIDTATRRWAPHGWRGVVSTSGFEAEPELLDRLARVAPLVGNDATVVRAVREPRRWFGLLDACGAPHPEVRYTAPPQARGWLHKSGGGGGGELVRPWHAGDRVGQHEYAQRRVPGRPASAMFVVDGREARILGWQWQIVAPTPELPWRFGGVTSAPDLPASVRTQVAEIAARIAGRTVLRGLGSLDFLCDGEEFQVLELNPRPTASVALYPQVDVFAVHLQACGLSYAPQRMLGSALASPSCMGETIVYAPYAVKIPADFDWPTWCRDIPQSEGNFAAGDPLCSIAAEGTTPAATRSRLAHQQRALFSLLDEERSHDPDLPQRQRTRLTPGRSAAARR